MHHRHLTNVFPALNADVDPPHYADGMACLEVRGQPVAVGCPQPGGREECGGGKDGSAVSLRAYVVRWWREEHVEDVSVPSWLTVLWEYYFPGREWWLIWEFSQSTELL